jgi:hypothetical protein
MPRDGLPSELRHAVRGRIAALQPFLDVLMQDDAGPLTDDQRACLEAIDRNLRRLFGDVTEMLELLGPDVAHLRLETQEMSCAELLHGAAQLVRARGLPEPTVREPARDLRVRADRSRTPAVLATLAARAGATATLSAARCASAPSLVCVSVGSPACLDSGCPPPETQEPVDASLLLCRALVGGQGGRLWVGAGAQVGFACVALPEADAQAN